MALSFTTGMTISGSGDSTTDYAVGRFSGSGGGPSVAAADDWVQGSGAIQSKLAGSNWDSWCLYDHYTANGNTPVNLTTAGNEVLAIWCQYGLKTALLNENAGGLSILVQSSAETGSSNPTVYSEWYVAGADTYPGGWVLFMIDTRRKPSNTAGGGANLASIRRIGIRVRNGTLSNVKGEPFYMDAIWYGRPRYSVVGDGSTVAKWADFLAHATSNGNGLIQSRGGVYFARCGLRIGSGSQGSTTNLTDATGQTIVFERKTYTVGGVVHDALMYHDYYNLDALGNGATRTTVALGSVVGTGDNRQGVLGGRFQSGSPANVPVSVDFDTDAADIASLQLAGVDFVGCRSGVLLDKPNGAGTVVSCAFINSGEVDPGTVSNGAEMLNFAVIDPWGYSRSAYELSNNDGTVSIASSPDAIGQSFAGVDGYLESVTFQIQISGSPTGDILVAELWAHTGTFGSGGTPTGSALATSDNVGGSASWVSPGAPVKFTFSTPVRIVSGTNYFITVRRSTGTASYLVGRDNSSPTHGGNGATLSGSWTAQTYDVGFILVVNPSRGLRTRASNNIKRGSFITSGSPNVQHLIHLPDSVPHTLALDAMQFFGDYSSATLWHAEMSAAGQVLAEYNTGGTPETLSQASSTTRRAQTFPADGSKLDSATFYLQRTAGSTGAGHTAQVALYATSGGAPTGSPLVTKSIDFDAIPSGALVRTTFIFDTEYQTSAATTYAIAFEIGGPSGAVVNIEADSGAGYGSGAHYRWNGSSWVTQGSDLRFHLGKADNVTVNASNGASPSAAEFDGTARPIPADAVVNNTITHTVNGLVTGSRVVWIRQSDEAALENKVESGGVATYDYNYAGDVDVWVQILSPLSPAKKEKLVSVTLGSTNQTLPASQEDDPFYFNP